MMNPDMDDEIEGLASQTLQIATGQGLKLATAESCTGGLVIAALTGVPGSSSVVDRGFVTYSNAAKIKMLDVPPALLQRHGAVSEEVARAMAAGALKKSGTDLAVAVTGIAGPGGGTAEKPVGLVHFACADSAGAVRHAVHHYGDQGRAIVRRLAVIEALRLLLDGAKSARGTKK